MHIHRDALADVARRVTALIERDGPLTLAALRDELQTSRRYAQALLEALDAERVTLRVGDERVLRQQVGLAVLRARRGAAILRPVKR